MTPVTISSIPQEISGRSLSQTRTNHTTPCRSPFSTSTTSSPRKSLPPRSAASTSAAIPVSTSSLYPTLLRIPQRCRQRPRVRQESKINAMADVHPRPRQHRGAQGASHTGDWRKWGKCVAAARCAKKVKIKEKEAQLKVDRGVETEMLREWFERGYIWAKKAPGISSLRASLFRKIHNMKNRRISICQCQGTNTKNGARTIARSS
jgi:hypothetical protein